MTPEIGQLTQLTGVGVAGLSVYLMWKLTSNHLQHLTNAVNRLEATITKLEEFLKNHYGKT